MPVLTTYGQWLPDGVFQCNLILSRIKSIYRTNRLDLLYSNKTEQKCHLIISVIISSVLKIMTMINCLNFFQLYNMYRLTIMSNYNKRLHLEIIPYICPG